MNRKLLHQINESVLLQQKLAGKVKYFYTPIIETILSQNSLNAAVIEETLETLLNFAFDESILILFKQLCRYYYNINPVAASEYIFLYREMWDEK